MAKQEPSEHIDPAFTYTDTTIKPISKRLTQLENSLLETQRTIARFMIFSISSHYAETVNRQKPNLYHSFSTQLVADASAARAQITTSKEPLLIYRKFADKYQNRLGEMGINLIDVS